MKQVKRFLSIFLSVMLFLSVCPMEWLETIDMPGAEKFEFIGEVSAAEEVIASGTCGDDITWTLTEDTEVEWDLVDSTPYKLTLTGSGEMTDYPYSLSSSSAFYRVPWYNYRATISNISVQDGITSIGEYAFHNCASLTTVSLPESILSIGSNAFYECSLLENIVIPDNVISIGEGAFSGCVTLENVTLGANLETIGDDAFYDCRSLYNIILNDKLTTIGAEAFAYTNLNNIELPDSLVSIGAEAFSGTIIESISIPESVASIGEGAFAGMSWLSNITVAEGNTVFKVVDTLLYEMKDGTPYLVLAYFNQENLTDIVIADGTMRIGASAFKSHDTLERITFPETLKEIGDSAFYGCYDLVSVALPDSVESLGYYCFFNCESLEKVALGKNLSTIERLAFDQCTALNTITCSSDNIYFEVMDNALYSKDHTIFYLYPAGRTDEVFHINDSVTALNEYSICYTKALKELYLPSELEALNQCSIYKNSNLDSIYFYGAAPDASYSSISSNASDLILFILKDASGYSAGSWANYVYANWDPLENLVVEGTFEEISWVFEGSMGRITFIGSGNIPDFTVEAPAPWSKYMPYIQTIEAKDQLGIGSRAFYQAENLLRMKNSSKTTVIKDYAFAECNKLLFIKTVDAYSIGDSAFQNCSSLTEVELCPQLTNLANAVFSGCTGITKLMLPESITSIGNSALKDCSSIRTINIPAAVTAIGPEAFSGGNALEKVYFYGGVPDQWAEDSFGACNSALTLYYRNSNVEWAALNGTWNSIPIKGQDKFYTEQEDHYSFENHASSFGYSDDYRIPRQRYVDVMNDIIKGTYFYAINKRWEGSCFGMASTTLEFYENSTFDISKYDVDAQNLYEIDAPANPKADLTKLIEGYHISQYNWDILLDIDSNMGQYQKIVQLVEEFERSGGLSVDNQAPPIVMPIFSLFKAHAVVPVSIERNENGDFEIAIYDCNYPNEFQTLIISKDYERLSYDIYNRGSYVDYTTIANLMSDVTLHSDVADTSLYLSINKEAGNVVNSEGKGIDEIEGAYEQRHLNGSTEDTFSGIRSFVLPEGNYTISSGDASSETDSATGANDTEDAEGVTFYMASADTFAEITTTDEAATLEIHQTDTENGELVLSLTNNIEDSEEETEEEKTSITLVNASGMERTVEIDSTSATISITEDEAITVEAPTEATVTVDGTPLVMAEGKAQVTFTASETENSLKVQDLLVDVSCGDANVLNGTVTASVISNSAETLDTSLTVTIEDVSGNDVAAYTTTQQINSGINQVSLELNKIAANFRAGSLTENLVCKLTVTDNNRAENTAYADKNFEVTKRALVAFDTNGGTGIYAPLYVAQNGTIPKPDIDPVRENYTFRFWSKDGVTEYDFAEGVTTAKVTLIAVWEANTGDGGNPGTGEIPGIGDNPPGPDINPGTGGTPPAVTEIPATAIKLNKKASITLNKGKTLTLTASLTPSNSTDIVTWSSSRKKTVSITAKGNKATVKALKKGTSTITAKTSSGKTVTCKITVKVIPATKVKLNKVKVTLNKGKTATLKATLTPKNSTDTLKWTSSNKSIAKVTGNGNKATISGLKKGTVTITAKSKSGKKATCKVTVKEIKFIKVKLNKTKTSLKVGKTVTLKATMTPKNSTDTIKWSSSNKSIAKVSATGKVTALKKGTATITAKTSSGKKATCKITVK